MSFTEIVLPERFPVGFVEAYSEALALGLSDPIGRALVYTSRRINDGRRAADVSKTGRPSSPKTLADFLSRVSPERAKRWRKHVFLGGSFRALNSSRAEALARRKANDKAYRETIKRIGGLSDPRRRYPRVD
jgi:hypothetical protein